MKNSVNITLQKLDDFFKPSKGWERNNAGNEYVYDYKVPQYNIMIKILSSIKIDITKKKNPQNNLRIFAVQILNDKITKGLVKQFIISIDETWQQNIKEKYKTVLYLAKKRT